jgi:hypothetical protein
LTASGKPGKTLFSQNTLNRANGYFDPIIGKQLNDFDLLIDGVRDNCGFWIASRRPLFAVCSSLPEQARKSRFFGEQTGVAAG